jgi:Tol biopolymer transport system component
MTLGQGNAEIFSVAADGSGAATNLTQNPGQWDGYPAWSPDGSRIAYSINDGREFNLVIMDADGSGRRILDGVPSNTGTANECCPAWQP